MKSRRGITALAIGVVAAAAAVGAATVSSTASARSDRASALTVRIWTDSDRAAAVTKVANQWAKSRGVTVQVVTKLFGNIRDDLKTVKSDDAPDVVVAAADWTGELAADGSVLPLFPKQSVLKQIPQYARNALSYNGRLFGMPTTLENVGLFVNTKLAAVPKSWADLEKRALAFKKKGGGRVALDVQQGSGFDAYHMYPLFSGLCGYIFGQNKNGSLNPKDLGIANPKFLKNAPLIDKWNKEGLINAKIDSDTAKQLFASGKAAYWITGPWNIDFARKAGITNFKIVQIPKIKCRSVPFLGVNGFMVTKFANTHGAATAAKDLVGSYMAGAGPQVDLATANGRSPANTKAIKQVKDPALSQIGLAGAGGVPTPNIPQMNSVWTDLGQAWFKSTQGAGATKARASFLQAQRNIRTKINSGG